MNPDDAKQYLLRETTVTRQQVTQAKAYIIKNFQPSAPMLIDSFLKSVDAKMPEQIVFHPTQDPVPSVESVAKVISWKLAACEAIWGLISGAAVFPASTRLTGNIGTLSWSTVVSGGGTSSGFSLDDLSIEVPEQLALPRSSVSGTEQPLTDPDMYLKELDLPGARPEIVTALQEAVRCFRHELYLACLAMLGRASEVAWIETGIALAGAAREDDPKLNPARTIDRLQDSFVGIGKKIQTVLDLYSRQDVFGDLAKVSGVKLQDLRNCTVWADCVRDSRNSIHYGVEPSMSNSYEKVAALLIGAVPHIRLLVNITEAAKKQATD